MYITRFPINLTRRETHGMLASPYRMHAAITGSFPMDVSTDEGRVLWRVDRNPNNSANLYIVSPEQPSLVGLDEQIGWPDQEPMWKTKSYDGFLQGISNGQTYTFRLVANAVVSRTGVVGASGRSKRLPHVSVLQKASWLIGADAYEDSGIEAPEFLARQRESRAERNGFSVSRDATSGLRQLVVSECVDHTFRQGRAGHRIRLSTVRYDGILTVTDADRLCHALTHGMGHGKGFGCGLLTLALLDG